MATLLSNLNLEQKAAVTHENGPLLIVAGAGTGKTTVITKRIAWLIEEKKASGDEILALTFTDKSAGEMEERVDQLLPYGYFDLWISTFHSFCDRILRDYALDIGLSNNYKMLNATEQWVLIRKNLDRFNLDYYRPFGNPTKFIHALIKHFSRCKDEGISQEEYLEYTEDMRLNQDSAVETRLIASLQQRNEDENSLDIKKIEEVANAYHIYQQILLENDSLDFGDLIQCTLKLFKERPNILKILREKFKYILVDEFQDTNWAQYELIKLLSAPKNNITCVADDDQSIYRFRGSSINNVLQFAKDYPKCEEVVLTQNYRSKQEILDLSYKFIQQNNPNRLEYHLNQNEVMRERAKKKGIDLKDYKNINKKLKSNIEGTAIIEHLHCESLEDEAATVVNKVLSIKYPVLSGEQEQTKDLVQVKKLGKQETKEKGNKNTPEKNESIQGATALPSADFANATSTSPWTITPSSATSAPSVSWSDFAILVRANDTAKPFINELEIAGIPYQFYSLRGLYNKPIILDICAYFRLLDNYHEASALYRILNMPIWRISYDDFSKLNYEAKKTGKSLYQTIKDITIGRDAINLPAFASCLRRQGADRQAGRVSTIEIFKKIVDLIEKHSALAKEKKVSQVITAFLNDSGYLEYLVKNENKENIKSLKYIAQFYKKIKDFEISEEQPRLKLFMEIMDMEIDAGEQGTLNFDPDDGPDMVKIMTIHSAKGLEFPYVFIVNLVDKKFPTIERKDPIEIPEPLVKEILTEGDIHLEEERRLFYVAMTRAKDGLFFTSAEDYGGVRKKKISRFLTEMGYMEDENKDKFQIPVCAGRSNFKFQKKDQISNIKYQSKKQFYSDINTTQKNLNILSNRVENDMIYTLPQKFSYTQLAAFKKCPLQYKFAHILKIPIQGKDSFSFGKTMHNTLQRFFVLLNERKKNKQTELFDGEKGARAKNIPTEKDLLQIYEECWLDEWYENDIKREEKKETGRKALKEFYKLHKDNWPNALYLEKAFSLRIGGYTLKGAIDRVDLLNSNIYTTNVANTDLTQSGGIEIVDYKTGKIKDDKKLKFEDKEQLFIYQIVAEECFNMKCEKLSFYYIEENKKVSFIGTPKELIKMKEKILNRIEKIKSSDFKANSSLLCKYCDYKNICEFNI